MIIVMSLYRIINWYYVYLLLFFRRCNELIFGVLVSFSNSKLELRKQKYKEIEETYDLICLVDMKSDYAWIIEKEKPYIVENVLDYFY